MNADGRARLVVLSSFFFGCLSASMSVYQRLGFFEPPINTDERCWQGSVSGFFQLLFWLLISVDERLSAVGFFEPPINTDER
jgi:hypothetical protein